MSIIKKILITGITGFIGSNIAKRLVREGYEVFAIIRNNSNIQKYELENLKIKYWRYDGTIECLNEAFMFFKPHLVIHTAAKFIAEHTIDQVKELGDSNIIFSMHLYEAMRISGCNRIINTSSSWEHFNDEVYNPVCLYAATKKASEDILKFYKEAENFSVITLSLYDSYGKGDKREKLISLLLKVSKSGNKLEMSLGEQNINLVYIDDIVDAYFISIHLIKKLKNEMKTYQIRSDESYSLHEICRLFEKVRKTHLNISWGIRSYRKREVMKVYNGGDLLPGWKCKVSLCEGLRRIDD